MARAPDYQSIAGFDYIVSPHGDDFGPYTTGTTTDGLQEALVAAGPGGSVFVRAGTYNVHTNVLQKADNQMLACEPGVTFLAASDFKDPNNPNLAGPAGIQGILTLGRDATNDFDGFVFEGNGCLFDGQQLVFPGDYRRAAGGFTITGFNRNTTRFAIRNFRVQNCWDYGVAVGRANVHPSGFLGSLVGLVTVENFDVFKCAWVRVWAAEHVVVRSGRCRGIPGDQIRNGWFVTSQHQTSSPGNLVTRDVIFEDLFGDVLSGQSNHDTAFEVQAAGDLFTSADVTRDIIFRRCYLRGRLAYPSPFREDLFIDDALGGPASGVVESLTFEDFTFDGVAPFTRIVSNDAEGYITYDHCDLIAGSTLPPTSFSGTGDWKKSRPIIVRRPASGVAYLDENSPITVGASPFTFANTRRYTMVVVVSGGTVSSIQKIPRGGAAVPTGEVSGVYYLGAGDALRVTYTAAPTMTMAPWY